MKTTNRFLRMGLFLAPLLFSSPLADAKEGPENERPNVLFIAIDDLNDWIGCLGGHPQVRTPNLDRLAARGTLFANAHCQSPLCNPSRTSVMTGLRPTTTGIYSLQPAFRTVPELKDYVSMPKAFAANGYDTSSCGKMYHKDAYKGEFQTVGQAKPDKKARQRSRPTERFVSPKVSRLDWGPWPPDDAQQRDFQTAQWAVDALTNKPNKPKEPFFMAVGFYRPHVPLYASQKWFDLYPEESLVLPPIRRDDRKDRTKEQGPRLSCLREFHGRAGRSRPRRAQGQRPRGQHHRRGLVRPRLPPR